MGILDRGFCCLLPLLASYAGVSGAQQIAAPVIQDAPASIPAPKATQPASAQGAAQANTTKAGATQPAQPAAPLPDKDGYYQSGPGVVSPRFFDVAPVRLPKDTPPSDNVRMCMLVVDVISDGIPAKIDETAIAKDKTACKVAMEASPAWKFTPGTVNGKAVPFRIQVNVAFKPGLYVTVPNIQTHPIPYKNFETPPQLFHKVKAKFTREARFARLEGTVKLEMTINENGVPKNIQVVQPLGMGLSEQAVKAARQYRYSPATKDGEPIAKKITLEIPFRLDVKSTP